MTYANQLEAVIYDCGGPEQVYRAVGLSKTSVWGWIKNGRLPLTEVTPADDDPRRGKTNYSDLLAGMQRGGRLTASEIRRIGLRL